MMRSYLELIRPANVITSVADVLAGIAISGWFSSFLWDVHLIPTLWLCLSTAALYAGGIVFNDVFDAGLDAVERPERAIPSGRIPLQSAVIFGTLLLILGIISAFQVNSVSGMLAVSIALLALLYDRFGKHHSLFGPLNMGLCRGVNLLLGMSITIGALQEHYFLAVFPVTYIAAITMISRGEVHGGSSGTLYLAGLLYLLVSSGQLWFAYRSDTLFLTALFSGLHLLLIFRPLLKAIAQPSGPAIGKAVKAGVLSLIVMDAAWVSVSGNLVLALGVLLLLPLSMFFARYFAVT